MLDWLLPAAVIAAVAAAVAALLAIRARSEAKALRDANDRLARQVGELASATHARSRFLAMMSHEIRTPLTGIVGFADVLADEPLSDPARRSLDAIRRSARALQALLGDILDFSRIDAGALPMQRRPVDLEALLLEIRDEFAPQARRRGLAFGLSVSEDARRWSETDPLRLRQVVVNLVSNAIRYTEAGVVRVSAGADPSDPDRVVIQVSDTGLGIAPEDCSRIFDAFAQAADVGHGEESGGVGLGLAIAHGLVQTMRGSLGLESTLGKGSTFTVTLPLPRCAPDGTARPRPVAAGPVAPVRILLVDDVAMNRELFAAMLTREGHSVTVAEDGETALRCLDRAQFDLALIDIQMPFMDGLDLTRRLRASPDPAVARLPVVALSAAAYGEDRDRAMAAGMDGYVTKPATRDDIAAALARVLNRAPAEKRSGPPTRHGTVVIDRAILDDQRATFGDGRVRRFLSLLREELERRRSALGAAALNGDRAELAQHAHAAASAAGNLGFQALLDRGRALEVDFMAMPAEAIPAALQDLTAAIDDATAAIDLLDSELAGELDRPSAAAWS